MDKSPNNQAQETVELAREEPNPKAGLAEWLMELSMQTVPLMNDGPSPKELMDELYDGETGLPK